MTLQGTTALEATLKRDRLVLVAGLLMVIGLSWIWILAGAGMDRDAFEMTHGSRPVGLPLSATDGTRGTEVSAMPTLMMTPVQWDGAYVLFMFSMWWVMMVAMMLPSASPMLLLFARLNRKEMSRGRPFVPTGIFATGYLIAWGAFSVIATLLQWLLEGVGLVSSMMISSSAWLAGILLIAAGVWQLTPIKQACLRHCRSPIGFLSQRWRNGHRGALLMGLEHGAYCLGCCWFLMGLLFYGGVMNLYWIAGVAVFVLFEKLSPAGHWVGKFVGLGLAVWGSVILVANF